MNFKENSSRTLQKISKEYPDAKCADLGAFRGDVGFWVQLKGGAMVFVKLIEPVKYTPPDGSLFCFFGE